MIKVNYNWAMETKKYEDEDLKITNIETWAKDALEKDQYYRTGGGKAI